MKRKNKFSKYIFISLCIGMILGILVEYLKVGYFPNTTINIVDFDIITAFLTILARNSIAYILLLVSLVLGKWFILVFFFINGFNVGAMLEHINIFNFMVLFLPHGILEYISFYKESMLINKLLLFDNQDRDGMIAKFFYYYGLLVIAAIVEVTVTPWLACLFI